MAIHAYESVLVIPMTESNKPLPPFTLPQPEPPKLTLWVAAKSPFTRGTRPATLDDLRAVWAELPVEDRPGYQDHKVDVDYWRGRALSAEADRVKHHDGQHDAMSLTIADRDEWKRRAEKAEARVAELEGILGWRR